MSKDERPDNHHANDGRREQHPATGLALLGQAIGRSRFVVLVAVVAVLLVALSLFLLGTIMAVKEVWHAWSEVFKGNLNSTDLTVQFLEIVSMMLKAVVFYIVGVGFYSLFIAPLNITVALGVRTLNDLESKVVSVVVVILAVTFLEHFIRWERPLETLQHGAAMALVVAALVIFQFYNHRAKEDQQADSIGTKAERELFEGDREQQAAKPGDAAPSDAADATANRTRDVPPRS